MVFSGAYDKYANPKETNEKWTVEQETVRKEMIDKLLKQGVKDVEIAIRKREKNDLQRLVTLGQPLLEMLTSSGQTVSDSLRNAGYDDLIPRTPPRPGR